MTKKQQYKGDRPIKDEWALATWCFPCDVGSHEEQVCSRVVRFCLCVWSELMWMEGLSWVWSAVACAVLHVQRVWCCMNPYHGPGDCSGAVCQPASSLPLCGWLFLLKQAGLCICPCWISRGSCCCLPSACLGPSEEQSCFVLILYPVWWKEKADEEIDMMFLLLSFAPWAAKRFLLGTKSRSIY